MEDLKFGTIKECCEDQRNREVVTQAGSVTIERCKVCGCRHHTLVAEPIEIGIAGAAL